MSYNFTDEGHEDSEFDDVLLNKNPDNEYYAFLNIPRDASDEDITAAYKKLCRLYHPDRHKKEKKLQAEALFSKLHHIYAVLSDPRKRAIYDCLGKEGISSEIWTVIKRTKTPKEIREDFELWAKYKEEQELQRRTNPTSRVTMEINATDLFDRYMYDELLDDVIEPSLPIIEVKGISLAQSIECPLTLTDKLVLSGNVNTRNGRGSGGLGCTLTRVTSAKSWHSYEVSFGNGPYLGGRYFRRLNGSTLLSLAANSTLYSDGIRPSFEISLENVLSKKVKGFLTYNIGLATADMGTHYVIEEEHSAMSTVMVYNGPDYFFSGSLQFGIPMTYLSFSAVKKFKEPVGKLRSNIK